MHRSPELLAKIVDASYSSSALIDAISVARANNDFVALKVEFRTAVEGALSWAFRTIGQLLVGEMIATQSDAYVLHARQSGLPEQIKKHEFFALQAIAPSLVEAVSKPTGHGPFAILVLTRCSAVLDPVLYSTALQAKTWLGCCAIKSEFKNSLPLPIRVGAGTHHVHQSSRQPAVVFMGSERMYGCRELENPASHLVVRQFLGNASITALNVDVGRFFRALGIPKQDYYGIKMDTNLGFDVCTDQPLTSETILSDIAQSASRHTLAQLSLKHIEARHAATALALERREKEISNRRRVRLHVGANRTELGLEPSNENETLILATRLEGYLAQQFFGHFSIREYTARDGIDSIVRYKRTVGEVARDVNAEFEFDFKNFFQHRHPLQQVDLIICWRMPSVASGNFNFGEGDFGVGDLVGSIETFRDWMKVITFGGHSITVVPLSKMPNIIVD